MSLVGTRDEDGILVLTFERPVLSHEVLVAAHEAIGVIDNSTRAVVVTSSHPSIFLAGAHLGEIAALGPGESGAYAEMGRRLMRAVSRVPVPIVAAVHGTCAGGGLDLVLACDWVVAAPGAFLGHPGIRRGLITGWGGTVELARRLAPAAFLGLVAAGTVIPAPRAASLGLVDELSDAPLPAALGRARRLASIEPRRIAVWRAVRSGGFIDRFGVRMVHTR